MRKWYVGIVVIVFVALQVWFSLRGPAQGPEALPSRAVPEVFMVPVV